MVHDACNCVIHGHSIWPKLFVSSCGKSKGSHPRGTHNVPMCSPLGRRTKGPPSFAESNGHTNHTRFMPDSYPNHAPPHSLPPIPHPGCFGGACRGPLESLVEECTCLVCSASNRCCLLAYCLSAERAHNPTIQLQSCESYPRIIPPNHTPNHTLESYHLFKLPGPTTVKKYTPIWFLVSYGSNTINKFSLYYI